MKTKECIKCAYNVPIDYYEKRGRRIRSVCISCRGSKTRKSIVYKYPPDLQLVCNKNATILSERLDHLYDVSYYKRNKAEVNRKSVEHRSKICHTPEFKKKESLRMRNHYNLNGDTIRKKRRDECKTTALDLTDTYCSKLVSRYSIIETKDVTPELIEIKRKQIKLKRYVKENS